MLGYAIVCFRDAAEAEFVLQAMNGLQVLTSMVYRPEDLSESGNAADLSDDPGFRLRVQPAEHGDAAPAQSNGKEYDDIAGADPPLVEQLRPLPLAELRRRLDLLTVAGIDAGAKIDMDPLSAAVTAYERIPRQVRMEQGSLVQMDIASRLLKELEGLRWPAKNHRPNLTSERYLVLLTSVTHDCYGSLRQLCSELMTWADSGFQYSAVAVTKNFVASPHIDERDCRHQYAVSLGSFTGGELCIDSIDDDGIHRVVVVETRNRIARIDGRHVHWVRSFTGGNRYSLIFYDTSGQSLPMGPAFDSEWKPAAVLQGTPTSDRCSAPSFHPCDHRPASGVDAGCSVKSLQQCAQRPSLGGDESHDCVVNRLACDGCGQTFSSRNALFRHLQEHGCSGNVRRRSHKCLVVYGYLGTNYHGSQRNALAEEALYPTVEGTLLSSVQSAMLAQVGATNAFVKVLSRTSRTDSGVHAFANVVCLLLQTEFDPDAKKATESDQAVGDASMAPNFPLYPHSDEHSMEIAVRNFLPQDIQLVDWLPLPSPSFDARNACQKREYWYYVPHAALWHPSELSGEVFDEEERSWIWVGGLPDEYNASQLQLLVESRLKEAAASLELVGVINPTVEGVDSVSKCSGYVRFSNATVARAACTVLDGARSDHIDDGHHFKTLIALPKPEAEARRRVHIRLRKVLGKLTGTRSFHNFSPGFASATSDPRSIRTVYRCRSEMKNGFNDVLAGRDYAVFKIIGRDFLYKQILRMSGLAIAVVRGSVPEAYMDLALGSTPNIEVPCAPAGNLVLAKCSFRDGGFNREDCVEVSATESLLREAVIKEISGEVFKSRFSEFVEELCRDVAPRMCEVYACAQKGS